MRRVLAGAVALAIAFSAAPGFAQDKLNVWWVKGFYKSEDEALYAAIKKYEAKTGVKVELSQYAIQDMNAKSVAALDAGTVPDIAYSDTYDVQTAGKWAFDGKLEDLSDVLAPMKDRFEPVALSTAFLYSDKAKKKAYYAFPIKQQTLHIQYWKDMLAQAGFKESDIPGTWKEYWSFWCDKVQPGIRQRQAAGRRSQGEGGPRLGAHRLHPALREGLHAAVVDDLEGPRQQRRLPQQDDRDDAQLHHLDRRQVAR